jgi:diguanylate cyclase (GGDEF)-like protein
VGWAFDLRTAIVVGALITLLTNALLLLSWRSLPRSLRPSLRWWLSGMLLHPVGFALVALRGTAPDWLSVLTANTVIALGLACMAISLRNFYDLPERRRELYGFSALVALVAVWFTDVQPSPHWRVVGLASLMAVLVGSSARAVFRRHGPAGTVPRLTGGLFALAALAMLARAGHELLWPALETNLIKSSAVNSVCLGALLLLPVLTTVGFLLMCTQRSQEELERTARLDHLTGIYNRRAIEDLASRALSAARRHGIPLAILILDLDHFKRINDQFGHEAGDRALIETVRRMREIMRAEDLVGRQGGEEFVALMPDIDLRSAHAAAERLRRAFAERPMSVPDGDGSPVELTVTVSVGVAALQADDLLFSHLLRRADRAMYAAKAAGRNKVMLDSDRF